MVKPFFRELSEELVGVFRRGTRHSLDDDVFDDLARRSFRYQFQENGTYRDFSRNRGVTPDTLHHWTEIPAVPTRAFKSLRLVSGPVDEVDVVFRTSGTSRGSRQRGEHHVLDLGLYRESLLPNFRDHLLADGARLPLVSLVPSPTRAPDSSLSYMMGVGSGRRIWPGPCTSSRRKGSRSCSPARPSPSSTGWTPWAGRGGASTSHPAPGSWRREGSRGAPAPSAGRSSTGDCPGPLEWSRAGSSTSTE